MTKKNFFNEQKVKTQIDALLPPERKEGAKKVWEVCKEIRKLSYVVQTKFVFTEFSSFSSF